MKSEKDRKGSEKKGKKRNSTVVILVALAAITLLAYYMYGTGQEEESFCGDLGRELAEYGLNCVCSEKEDLPSSYENLSAKALCECRCYVNETWISTVVAVPENVTWNETGENVSEIFELPQEQKRN